MKVGVISDTHLAGSGLGKLATQIVQKVNVDIPALKAMLKRHFRGVSVILHAGDLVDWAVLEMLEDFGKVYAVAGNMDPAPVRDRLPEKRVVRAGQVPGRDDPRLGIAQRSLRKSPGAVQG